ncbi:DUF4349 domain-containing protein [Microbacterium sp. USHLN186]|uniref:DUF4349 domain-containing protein n=1 Tax=Microbacterium sp. USHLN186 TaxID=3081286 RepID=UPI003018BC01
MSGNSALPPLSDESIARIERAVFDRIADEKRPRTTAPVRHPRRRAWLTGLGVAAAFVAGALIAPPLLDGVGPGGPASVQYDGAGSTGFDPSMGQPETADGGADSGGADSGDSTSGGMVAPRDDPGAKGADAPIGSVDDAREIITTAQTSLRVKSVARAADAITTLAAEHGGYVESSSLGLDPDAGDIAPEEPRRAGEGRIGIRIPAADLEKVLTALADEGEILRSSISRDDVTATAVDLRARIDAARTSVKRLTELMGKAGSVGDLLSAESALSERQAQLESYEQQLKSLDEQVSMSAIQIELTEQTTPAVADPAGFGDGLLAGWNGLVAGLNGLVIVVGFLLPWLAIAAVALTAIWLVRRRRLRVAQRGDTESA